MKTKNNIPQERSFIEPDNYFEDSREKMTTRLAFENLVKNSSTVTFDVPDGYFEDSKKELLYTLSRKRIETNPSIAQETKVIPLRRNFYSIAGIAAALLFLISIWILSDVNTTQPLEGIEIVDYFNNTNVDIEEIDFADLLTDEDIEALQYNIAIEETDIIEYLEERTDSYDFYIK